MSEIAAMFSIIVCSHRPQRTAFIRDHYASLFRERAHEFILIDDARSLCEGYTRGLARSRGELLIFSHDDVEFVLPDAVARIEAHLMDFDLIGIAGTTKLIDGSWFTAGDPYSYMLVTYPVGDGQFEAHVSGAGPLVAPGIQALDGCFMACRRAVAELIGFDAETFDGFHLYDLDFSFRACESGFALAVCRDLPLIHLSRGGVKDAEWRKYRERFELKHAGRFAHGAAGPSKEGIIKGNREHISIICQPENMLRAIRQLEGMFAPQH